MVAEARVAVTDDHGELGRALVKRSQPFPSTTTAGGLPCTRGSTDYSYINRCPPPVVEDGVQASTPSAPHHGAQIPDVQNAEQMGHALNPELSTEGVRQLGFGLAWATAWRARVRAAAAPAAVSVDLAGPRTQNNREARPPVRTWFSGFRVPLTEGKRCVLLCIAGAWRAAHCCDFYITKYLSLIHI